MKTDEAKYILMVQEHGVEEAILGNEIRCAAFLQILIDAVIQGFGANKPAG